MTLAVAEAPRELIRIQIEDREAIDLFVEQGLDLWDVEGRLVRAYTSEQERAWLAAEGYTWVSEQAELEALLAAEQSRRAVDGYFTFAEYVAAMNNWATNYPSIVSLSSIGTSIEGRPIWMLKISDNVAVDEDEPKVLLISLQHAREWLSGMTVHGVANHLITQYSIDPRVTSLVNDMEIYVLLVANPDGYVYTHTTDRTWRKNRRFLGGTNYGVDLNRNFPVQFSSGSQSSGTYGGTAPFSEPETVALDDFLKSRMISGILNYHTYGTRVMHLWAHKYELPPHADLMGDVVYDMAQAIETVHGQTFRNGSWAVALDYLGNGVTDDYTESMLGIPTLTLELRPPSEDGAAFYPTGAAIAPSVDEHIEGALFFLEWIRGLTSDTTPPVVSDVEVYKLSHTEATVRWMTDDPATRVVEYGTTTAYGSSAEPDKLRGITHEVRLTGLAPSTTYQFRAGGENLAGLTGFSANMSFTTAATAQDITPPQYSAITVLRRTAPGLMEMQWQNLGGGPYAGFRLYESADEGQTWSLAYDENTLFGLMTSAILPSPPPTTTKWYRLTAVDNSPNRNESIPSDTYAIRVGTEATRVLVVDGFDRWNSMRVADGGKNHPFAAFHGSAIHDFGLSFDTCANEAVGSAISLLDYDIVVWVLGTESTATDTFSTSEQTAVRAFLEAGGNLFVSGSDIGYDLYSQGSTADRAFYNNYLSAGYGADSFGKFIVYGAGGSSIFETTEYRFDDGSRRTYRVTSPDRITTSAGSTLALRTNTSQGAAVQRHGLFGSSSTPGRVVMLSFPFETVYPAEARNDLMASVLDFFGLPAESNIEWWMLY